MDRPDREPGGRSQTLGRERIRQMLRNSVMMIEVMTTEHDAEEAGIPEARAFLAKQQAQGSWPDLLRSRALGRKPGVVGRCRLGCALDFSGVAARTMDNNYE